MSNMAEMPATGMLPGSTIRIVDYEPRWRTDFARLNTEWLQRWFVVEEFDRKVLEDPETHLLGGGGHILFGLLGEGDLARAVGTVALRHDGNGSYEMTKMAVEPGLRGKGIGQALLQAAIALHRRLQGRELYLESSSRLETALRMYEKAGFVHQPAPRPGSHYARADVYMIWQPPA